MKKLFYNILMFASLGCALTLTSCRQDFEEINSSPNQPLTAPSSAILNSAVKELMDATRGPFSSGRMFLPWVQYSAQINYTEEDRYRFRENVNQALYRDYYYVARDFKFILDMNTDPETMVAASTYGPNSNQVAVSRIMLSYVFSQLADTYGDIPYYSYGNPDADFQGLDVLKYPNPKFASQEKIYTDILSELKAASDMINTSQPIFNGTYATGDQIYGGNSTKWKKFANSLRLRIATRLKGAVPTAQAHIDDAIAAGVMTGNDDNAQLTYQTIATFAAPMYIGFVVDARLDFQPADTFVKTLKAEKGPFGIDPRLQKMIAPKGASITSVANNSYSSSTDLSNYVGMPYGVVNAEAPKQAEENRTSNFANPVLRSDATLTFMEYSEVEFLLSEANGWDQAHYENGVKASMELWGVSASEISTYLTSLAPASAENVISQKWIALYTQPMEAWSEYRRTGYPSFLLKPGQTNNYLVPDEDGNTTYTFQSLVSGLTDLPNRVTYPINLGTLNPTNYVAAQQAVGGDKMDTKLIWDRN